MIDITPCQDRFEELVSFAARLNRDGAHHIGFFGEGEADVRASLAECLIPPADGFRLAYEGDQLVGVFGVDADPEINRAWLFGPLVEHEDWHTMPISCMRRFWRSSQWTSGTMTCSVMYRISTCRRSRRGTDFH